MRIDFVYRVRRENTKIWKYLSVIKKPKKNSYENNSSVSSLNEETECGTDEASKPLEASFRIRAQRNSDDP